ncbi:MAG TPA: ketoacyl-ACP synthase III [Streptosporangiaceae bacterium]|nr:ketoacyl-ACP synthase III [Streptosporangiaceae bacterium]
MADTQSKHADHWMALESPDSDASSGCRIESVGVKVPSRRLTTKELMSKTKHRTRIQLERLTGIHERHVVGPGESSYTLAVGAARDCLAHSQHEPQDIEMLISTSITRSKDGSSQSFEPPLSLYIKQAIGATRAVNFDVSNACAGMLTGVFLLQDLVTRGEIKCGMVVSGEYISHLSWNAAKEIRSLFSKQLASLTLGDAGAAVIVEQAPDGAPGIEVIGFTTLAEHSRLCLAFPSTVGPGAQMYTKSRKLHNVAIEDMAPLVSEVIGQAGIDLADIDYLIPHQTSARAIRKGTQEFARRLGTNPKHVVVNLEEYGNTSSTTLFVALHKYLQEGRMHKGDRVMLLALASGIEIGIAIFTIDNQVDHYGRTH